MRGEREGHREERGEERGEKREGHREERGEEKVEKREEKREERGEERRSIEIVFKVSQITKVRCSENMKTKIHNKIKQTVSRVSERNKL